MTNKPHSPVKLLPDPHDPAKKAVEIQATPYSGLIDASGDVGSVAQKQLDLLMAENDKLRTTNNELEKDKEIMENQLYDFGKRNEDLMTVNQYLRAQYSKARDNLYALRQEFVNPSSASAPPVGRHQEAMHRQDPLTYTVSYAGAPPTEPRFPARLMDYPPVQDMPLLELEKGGPRKNTRQQPRAPSDEENYSPVMPVAKPTQAQGQLGASVDEGNLSSPLGTEISLTISDGMEY
ncbi:uncharacterized protein EDB91DRAFT_26673 [Suillus paluster]|uniref:uncharacterized protein n=1 Tax=Suillus paluster TaxID=48578 RepID=UPI001B882986|nr:uncharacterized protein EDB91DRAFT_26673 [Suillus paluster]KAG1756604.1 hypothetical protein EDB91DRAFT_26673 [Suillus paluster]